MSDSLSTPTGRPASSITGAALKPLSVRNEAASFTVAPAATDTGFSDIRSAAVAASRTTRGADSTLAGFFMAHLSGAHFTPPFAPHRLNPKAFGRLLLTVRIGQGG